MTPEQKIKQLIIHRVCEWEALPLPDMVDGTSVDVAYQELDEGEYSGQVQDVRNEVRYGEERTGLKTEGHYRLYRDYDAEAVASQMLDGSWVGWIYWHGGGRHAEPQCIDWMSDAYELNCTEAEKVIIERTFQKV